MEDYITGRILTNRNHYEYNTKTQFISDSWM